MNDSSFRAVSPAIGLLSGTIVVLAVTQSWVELKCKLDKTSTARRTLLNDDRLSRPGMTSPSNLTPEQEVCKSL